MTSLVGELLEKIRRDPRVTSRGGARADLGLLLFGAREELDALWKAADASLASPGEDSTAGLRAAVERLRPLFGPRP